MKKRVRKFLAMALAVVMSMSVSAPVFAAEAAPDDADQPVAVVAEVSVGEEDNSGGIMPLAIVDSGVVDGVGSGYKTIINNPNGVGGKVSVRVISDGYNGWTTAMDVIAYDRDGHAVHQKENIAGIKADFSLDCGYDIVRVEVRIHQKFGSWTDTYYTLAWYVER